MYKIGEFARIVRVTAKALRLYDEMGILRPFQIDPVSGYRYYSAEQIVELDRIMVLKGSGFTLAEIAAIQSGQLATVEGLVTLLEGRIMELEREIQARTERISRIRSRISAVLTKGVTHMTDVVVKSLEPVLIASLRRSVSDFGGDSLGPVWRELNTHINKHGGKKLNPCMTLYHNDGEDGFWDISVGIPLAKPIPESDAVKVIELPAIERMACTIYKGPLDALGVYKGLYNSLGETYRELTEWVRTNNCELVLPIRELYHEGYWITEDPNEYVTEVQFAIG